MPKKKKKTEPLVKYSRGILIDPTLVKARSIRQSLLKRAPNQEIKDTTPHIKQIHKWINRQNYICYYSLEPLTLETISIDHKIPLQRNGDNSLDNLCICSKSMNTAKGVMTENEFRNLLELIKTWEDKGESLLKRLKQGHFG